MILTPERAFYTWIALLACAIAVGLVARAFRHLQSRSTGFPRICWAALKWGCTFGTLLMGLSCLYIFWFTYRPQPAPETRTIVAGITYTREIRQQPRPLVIHVTRIDLSTPGLEFLVTPPEPLQGHALRAQKTSTFVRRYGLNVAISGGFFTPWYNHPIWGYPKEGDPVTVAGISASRGEQYTPRWTDATLFIAADNTIAWAKNTGPVYNAISGGDMILRDGAIRPKLGDQLNPQAAIGADAAGRMLFFIVIDGRQPNYSEGVSVSELAIILKGMGIHNAINLDSGGSATIAAAADDGSPRVLNSPTGTFIPGDERPVANHLGARVRIASPHNR